MVARAGGQGSNPLRARLGASRTWSQELDPHRCSAVAESCLVTRIVGLANPFPSDGNKVGGGPNRENTATARQDCPCAETPLQADGKPVDQSRLGMRGPRNRP